MRITIRDYSADWVPRFATECDRLTPALPAGAVVEHIGSTAVPGLAAKDIVDVLIGLPDFDAQAAEVVPRIVALGYVYLQKHENVMPFRRFFHLAENDRRTHHVHMVGTGTPFWRDQLLFRDHLRQHPAARLRYETLKRRLAECDWTGMDPYAEAKGEFIRAILAEAAAPLRARPRHDRDPLGPLSSIS